MSTNTAHLTDLEIATQAKLQPVVEIARKLKINEDDLEQYGKYKAKLPLSLIDETKGVPETSHLKKYQQK